MKKIIILYFFGALLLSGCMRDEFDTTRVEEGIAACVSLRMLMPDMTGAVSAGGSTGNTRGALGSGSDTRTVSSDVENRLDNLRVLIFNGSGEVVTNRKYTAQPDGPSLSSLQIDTWSGSNHTFCFVANSKDDMDSRLAAVTSYDALREFMVTASGLDFGLNSTEPLVMTAIREHVDAAGHPYHHNPRTASIPGGKAHAHRHRRNSRGAGSNHHRLGCAGCSGAQLPL